MIAVGTMKLKLKWLAIVLAVSLLGFGTALFLWPRDRITAESWEKIQIGMTENQVEKILGGPGTSWKESGFRDTDPFPLSDQILVEPNYGMWILDNLKRHKYWTSKRGCMQIEFDLQGHVSGKAFWPSGKADPNFLDRLRDWLGW
jgi:hypothetical protein